MASEATLDSAFRALGDGSRRGLVARLSRGPASVSELAAPLEMSLPAVMQHLEVLERCGLITTEKRGRVRFCELEPARMAAVEGWLSSHRGAWETRLDRLGDLLEDPGGTD